MAEQLLAGTIAAPGFNGLNSQDSGITLSSGFALTALNCVIDKYGRIGARKGWSALTTTNTDLGSNNIQALQELIENDGSSVILAAGNNKLFRQNGSTLVTLTYDGGGAAPTISANNWSTASLNGVAYFFQAGHDPLVYDAANGINDFRRVSEQAGYSGSVPQADIVLSAYGRLWVARTNTNKQVIQFSDLQAGHKWTAGTSGSLDLTGVWPYGTDEIVALAAHNGFLIIFGSRQILIYSGAKTPSTMVLADDIGGIGCIARDSVQNTGTDIFFLSNGGVRSLLRTIQEKSMPFRDVSRNVRDELMELAAAETGSIKSAYSDKEAFYLISFPSSGQVYCFDTRAVLPDGSSRATTWDSITPTAFLSTADRRLLLGKAGTIAEYLNYTDNGDTYRLEYFTNNFDLEKPTNLKIMKKIGIVSIGGANQPLVVKWGFDYTTSYTASSVVLNSANVSEYGIAQYGIDEFSQGIFLSNVQIPTSGTGAVIQIGFEVEINGAPISFQKIDIFCKEGRTI